MRCAARAVFKPFIASPDSDLLAASASSVEIGSACGACPGTCEACERLFESSIEYSSNSSAASFGLASLNRSAAFGGVNAICVSFQRLGWITC